MGKFVKGGFVIKKIYRHIENLDIGAMAPYLGECSYVKKKYPSDGVIEAAPYTDFYGLYGRRAIIEALMNVFDILTLECGNSRLVFDRKGWKNLRKFANDRGHNNIEFCLAKFKGNRTKHNIFLFLEFEGEMLVNCYDVTKINPRYGLVPQRNQIMVFQIMGGQDTVPDCVLGKSCDYAAKKFEKFG